MPADAFQALKPRPSPGPFDRAAAARLESELQRTTKAEVRFDGGSRALYATDGSIYRQVPIGVVIPRSVDGVMGRLDEIGRAHVRNPVTYEQHDRGILVEKKKHETNKLSSQHTKHNLENHN